MEHWEFYRRMPVYLANRRLLGHTVEIGHAMEYIHVQQGRLLVRDWYIPIGAIQTVTPLGINLNVTARDLRQRGWNVPSEEFLARQGLVVGYEYTSPGDIPDYGAPPNAPVGECLKPAGRASLKG